MTEPIAPPQSNAPRADRGRERVVELDLLRFVAALAVVVYHFGYPFRAVHAVGGLALIARIGMHGYLGVDLFFMISGFVVLWSARGRSPTDFVVARVVRLYPEFWIGVILAAIAYSVAPLDGTPAINATMVAANLTMIPQVLGQPFVEGVYWTLFVELKFYFLLWVLLLLRQMPRVEWWLFGWLVIAALCTVSNVPHFVRSLAMDPFAPLFIGGALFYLIHAEGVTAWRIAGVLACAALAALEAPDGLRGFVPSHEMTRAAEVQSILLTLSFFAAFAVLAGRRLRLARFATPIAFLGALTYPLYLVHNIARALLLEPLRSEHPYLGLLLATAFAIALSGVMALTVDRYVRRPFSRWLTRLSSGATFVAPRP